MSVYRQYRVYLTCQNGRVMSGVLQRLEGKEWVDEKELEIDENGNVVLGQYPVRIPLQQDDDPFALDRRLLGEDL